MRNIFGVAIYAADSSEKKLLPNAVRRVTIFLGGIICNGFLGKLKKKVPDANDIGQSKTQGANPQLILEQTKKNSAKRNAFSSPKNKLGKSASVFSTNENELDKNTMILIPKNFQ